MLLVVVGKTRSLSSHPFKDVIDKGVHYAHCLGGDSSVWVDLLQNLVDVDRVALLARLPTAFLFSACLLDSSSLLLSLFGSNFDGHVEIENWS